MSLLDKFPSFWLGSPEFCDLQQALDPEAAALRAVAEDAMAQLDVNTATWGLKYWEQALGVPVDKEKEPAYRRSRIISKLRGAGVTTTAMVKSVAEAFSNGEVEIISDSAAYTVTIKFVGAIGTPPNMADLTAALRDIMPAHLAWVYEYTYNTWAVTKQHTWAELKSRTWAAVKGEKWI